MEKHKPIKRNRSLVPLSREHHDGLLLCWKIRFGIQNNIDVDRIVKYVQYFRMHHLEGHFRKEEEYVFTLLPDTDDNKIEAIAQHEDIRHLLRTLDTQPGYVLLGTLAAQLEKHIRFEERTLFVHIENTAGEPAMAKLNEMLYMDSKPVKENWKDSFWLKK